MAHAEGEAGEQVHLEVDGETAHAEEETTYDVETTYADGEIAYADLETTYAEGEPWPDTDDSYQCVVV